MSAILSGRGRYRYILDRWMGNDDRILLYVMLNPSTADERQDDPTIRKCCGFAGRLGYGRIRVVNLYAWRATKPKKLCLAEDPVGPSNDLHLTMEIVRAERVIVAWGAHVLPGLRPPKQSRIARICEIARLRQKNLECLGTSADGSPRHPLMLPYSTQLESWTP